MELRPWSLVSTEGTYFNCIMFMVASSVVLTVVVLNYHHRTADIHEMPHWIKCVFLQWLPWILGMSRPGKKITRKTILMSNRMKELELKERSSKSLLANVLDIDDDFRHGGTLQSNSAAATAPASSLFRGSGSGLAAVSTTGGSTISTSGAFAADDTASAAAAAAAVAAAAASAASRRLSPPPCALTQRELQAILRELQFITNRMRKADEEAELISDWKFAAMVVDRFCLIVFTLFTVIATVAVLLSAPHIIVQ